MGKKLKSVPWPPVTKTVFYGKCNSIDAAFNTLGLSRAEVLVPNVGLYTGSKYAVTHVRRQLDENEVLVKPMKFIITFSPEQGLQRIVEQTLTKPMQLNASKIRGFSYQLNPKSDAVISKLVVNINDLDAAIDELIAEANRVYLLYCYPA